MNNKEIESHAIKFARKKRKEITKKLTDIQKYKSAEIPVSIFMAGSPGAGKTEFSKNIIDLLENKTEERVVRIDGDELRPFLPGYTGKNSSLFQGAISLIIEKIHDFVLSQKQSFVLDGTFSKYEKAVNNIERSLSKNREVFIFYVYQKPEVAWNFTQKREESEGRNIPKKFFIEQFFGARDVVNKIINKFTNNVTVYLVVKNFENHTIDIIKIHPGKAKIDDYIKERYTKNDLEKKL